MTFEGFRRPDGSAAVRNLICIISVDECCEGIARQIARDHENIVILTNWYTCMLGGNEETFRQMVQVGTSPNVAAVIVLAMGCGSIEPEMIAAPVRQSGRPVESIVCEQAGGTRKSIEKGREILERMEVYVNALKRESIPISELVVGVKCGGSDTSSGIASNPAVGNAVDRLVDMGATCIAGELFELQGCDEQLKERAASPEVAGRIIRLIDNENRRWNVPGTEIETMSVGNCVGGLTTIEEKSLGALHKTGTRPIKDVLQINKDFVDKPSEPGFYLSEVSMLCGAAGVNFASLGTHVILWTSGAAGFNNEIVPVIRVSGNTELMNEDMDVDVSGIMRGEMGIDKAGELIVEKVLEISGGRPTRLEGLGYATMTLYQKDQRVETLLGIPCRK